MKYFFSLFCLLSFTSVFAQRSVEVRVVDEQENGIQVFTVRIPGGSITDGLNGLAVLTLPNDRAVDLVIESDDYLTKVVHVSPSDLVVESQLEKRYTKLAPVTVYGSLTSDGPSTAESIDEDHLRNRAGNSLSESIDGLPGVHSVNTGVGISKPMIRGFVGTRVNVVQDGILQEGQQWGMDHGLEIDQFSVNSVSILTGVKTLEYGPASASGIVLANSDNTFPPLGFHGEVSGIAKSNNKAIGTSTSLSYRWRNVYVRGRFTLQDFGDYRVPAESFTYNGYNLTIPDGVLKNTAGTEINGNLDFGGYVGIHGYWKARVSRFSQKIGLFPGAMGIPRQFDISDVGNQRDVNIPYQRTVHDKIQVSYNSTYQQDFNGTWALEMAYQHNHREERSAPHAHGLNYVDPNNTLGIGLDLRTTQVSGKRKFNWLDAHWSVGGSAQFQENERSGWEFLLPTFSRQNYGVYALSDFVLGSWNISTGVRFDQAHMVVTGYEQPWYAAPDSLVERVPNFESNYWAKSFSLGAAKSWNDFQFTGQLSYSERIPAVAELASNGVHHGTFRHEVGNPDLELERGTLIELSVFKELVPRNGKGSFEFKVTGWAYLYSNYIFLNPTGEFSPLPDAGQIYAYEHAPAYISGMEIHLAYHASKYFNLSINSDQILESRNRETGGYLPFQPATSISLIPEFSNGAWKVGAEVVNTFAQNRVANNERQTPGYILLNAYAQYSIQLGDVSSLELRLRGQNLTNAEYLRHISRYRILNLPEQGINLILQVAYKF
ncbi:TonB-dependent receptor [Phaeocystidibacter marisrubri]|uniref:TonB-dependent receptor n=1 Tax=Phaeocystidibacter marisrubri TaxID=1577780 RepID=A0A6L3ZHS0_9FLAO|nr:TonB-dependent receptor plug domain-containing protein [Phaeocystidibacter marisrubri]KAB2817566.1 TonB-dependent receptor [Phaeocystidibacter marisrubri]GGH74710.1 TonB-dependent receptor [Phaeocystidibacter marisrubri]